MKTFKKSLLSLALAAGSLAVAGNAAAATITYNFGNHAPAAFGANYSLETTNWQATLNLPQWNPALFPGQVLTGAVLKFGGKFQSTGQIDSEDAQDAAVTVTTGVRMRFYADGSNGSTDLFSSNEVDGTTSASRGRVDLSADLFDGTLDADSDAAPDYTGGDAAAGLSIGAENFPIVRAIQLLGNVTGAGNFNVYVDVTSLLTIIGTANLSSDILTRAAAQIEVEYTYQDRDVPEPATLGLLGLGLFGMGAARRKLV